MKNPITIKTTSLFRTGWRLKNEVKPKYNVEFVREIDASSIESLRLAYENSGKLKPSYTTIVMKAAAQLLTIHPMANRAVLGLPFFKRLIQFQNIDISVAVNIDDPNKESYGFAATIKNTPDQSLEAISTELNLLKKGLSKENAKRLKDYKNIGNKLPPFLAAFLIRFPFFFPKLWAKHRGCACLINSPAQYGVDLIIANWSWPLTISFGMVKERPFVVNGRLMVKRTMPLVMVFDIRVMLGTSAAKIFNDLAVMLENASEHFGDNDAEQSIEKQLKEIF